MTTTMKEAHTEQVRTFNEVLGVEHALLRCVVHRLRCIERGHGQLLGTPA